MKLTDTAIKKAKPQDKTFRMADGGGMYIEIKPNGSKYWRLAYRYANKQKTLALGVYPDVSLADARERRNEARKLLANDADPGAIKQIYKKQAATKALNSFELIAREFHALKSPMWSANHVADWISTLEREIFPKFGSKPITEIDAPNVLDAICLIEGRGAYEVAARVLQRRVRTVCAYAIATGRARHNPASDIRGALAPQPKVSHFAALSEKELPEFLRALASYPSYKITKAATRLLMLTFVRTGEIRGAKWAEVDLDSKQWIITPDRMKSRQPHIVPLSKQAIQTLIELQPLTGHDEHLFPSCTSNGKVISENTILKVIERLGYKGRMTGHGFRTIASTYLNGVGMIRHDVIEAQLAHSDRNTTRAAYNRADYMEYRKAMMQFWADTLDAMQKGQKLPRWADYEPSSHKLDRPAL